MASKSARQPNCRCGRLDCGGACMGLECLERPRFFAGQLLTESELNSLQDYVLAKNRLHNLHQHGWGVVCGLEVTCHDCDGWVTVHPGYAIDSCGNDVVVCKTEDVNVLDEIRRCREARRLDDCRRPVGRGDCDDDGDEYWCLTLSYAEVEGRPTTALNQEPQRCDCGCSCGGKGGSGCSCGGGKRGGSGNAKGSGAGCRCGAGATRAKHGVGKTPGSCEPTRILECYRFDLCQSTEGACKGHLSSGEEAWLDKFRACFQNLRRTLRGFPQRETLTLGGELLQRAGLNSVTPPPTNVPPPPPGGGNLPPLGSPRQPIDVHRDYSRVYDYLRELFRRNPGNLHCALLADLDALGRPVPEPNDTFDSYWNRLEQPATSLLGYLVVYLFDCLCHAALPPCAPCCPGEDPLVLACMTVRDGRIIDICNYSCRRYAGVFPPSLYGIYLGPLMPILTKILELFCCGDFLGNLLGQIKGRGWVQNLGNFIAADNFTNSRYLASEGRRVWAAANQPPQQGQLPLARFVGEDSAKAVAEAREAGIEVTVHEVPAAPLGVRFGALAAARPGDEVKAYTSGGKVVGFAARGSADAVLVEQAVELATLRREVDELKGRLGGGTTPPVGKAS